MAPGQQGVKLVTGGPFYDALERPLAANTYNCISLVRRMERQQLVRLQTECQ